ncbi:hypothetical protein HK102_009032, partial [Quaeritorhiza haematococci]
MADQKEFTEEDLRMYREAQRQLAELVTHSQDSPLKVHAVHVKGVKHTRHSLLESLINPIQEATTLRDVFSTSQQVCRRLVRLGIVKDIKIVLDTPPGGGSRGGNKPNVVDVVLEMEEVPRIFAKTGTHVGNYEGTMNATVMLRNVFGGGETLEANANYGVETSIPLHEQSPEPFKSAAGSSFQCTYSKPIDADPDRKLEYTASKSTKNFSLFSSHEEKVNGVGVRYKALNTLLGNHEFSYDLSWRNVCNLAGDASW